MTNQRQVVSFDGIIQNVRRVPTKSGRCMAVFTVGIKNCKCFGALAEHILQAEGDYREIQATLGQYLGQTEYAVVGLTASSGGHQSSIKDAHFLSSSAQTTAKHSPVVARTVPSCPDPTTEKQLQAQFDALGNHDENERSHPRRKWTEWNIAYRRKDPVCVYLNEFFASVTDAEWQEWERHPDRMWPHIPDEPEEVFARSSSFCGIASDSDVPQVKARFEGRLAEIRAKLNTHRQFVKEERQNEAAVAELCIPTST